MHTIGYINTYSIPKHVIIPEKVTKTLSGLIEYLKSCSDDEQKEEILSVCQDAQKRGGWLNKLNPTEGTISFSFLCFQPTL